MLKTTYTRAVWREISLTRILQGINKAQSSQQSQLLLAVHLSQNIFKPRPCNLPHGYTWGSAENSKQLILHIHVAVYQSFPGRLLAPYFLASTTTVMIPKNKLPRLEGYWDEIVVKFFRTRLLMGKLHSRLHSNDRRIRIFHTEWFEILIKFLIRKIDLLFCNF